MPAASVYPLPVVEETLSSRSLSFAGNEVQSVMRILEPDLLELEYTRLMLGFLVFCPAPQRLLVIGLGGGSLAKFCYAYMPETDITVVEINPHVIALRTDFAVPDDDARFRVVRDDAASFVAQTRERFDVVLVDGFDVLGVPEQLSSPQFYADCRAALAPAGTVVVNLHRCHPGFPVYLDRLHAAFEQPLTRVNDQEGSNCLVFAQQHAEPHRHKRLAMRRPKSMPPPVWSGICSSVARVFLEAQAVHRQAPPIAELPC